MPPPTGSPVLADRPPGFSLPFVLPGQFPGDGGSPAVISRLDALHELLQETRSELRVELEQLRRDSSKLLSAITPPSAQHAPPPRRGPAADEAPVERRAAGADEIEIRLFGTLVVQGGGRVVDRWTRKKARQLLAALSMTPGRSLSREALVEMFWPGSSPVRGSNNLSIAVHHIRSRLAPLTSGESRGLTVEQGMYRLDAGLRLRVDVAEFEAHVAAARDALQRGERGEARVCLEAAVDLYTGDFLESDAYEEWTLEPRRALAGACEWAMSWLAGDAAEALDWQRVLRWGQELVRRDPANEEAHRCLIRAHGALGNRGQALRQYRACRERLRGELGVEPSAETVEALRSATGLEG